MTGVSPRLLPMVVKDAKVVRCICASSQIMGDMVRCKKCLCLSHQQCVKKAEDFICEFCMQAAQGIIKQDFNSLITPEGVVFEIDALKDFLVHEITMLEICEVREHSTAAPQVITLFALLMKYFACVNTQLDEFAIYAKSIVPQDLHSTIDEEIEIKRKAYQDILAVIMEARTAWLNEQNNAGLLQYFRDSVLHALT